MKKIRTIKVGLIGLQSNFQYQYAEEFLNNPSAKVVAISLENKVVGESLAKKINADWIPKWRDLIKQEELDAICIGSENKNHYHQIIESLSSSKHVLCESPLVPNLNQYESISKIRKDTKTKLLVPFKPRFNSSLNQVKKLVTQGDIGEIGGVYFSIFNPQQNKGYEKVFNKKKNDEICINNIESHAYDYILWLLETQPERIYSITKRFFKEKQENAMVTTIKFSNGTIATLIISCPENRSKSTPQKTFGEMKIELTGFNRTIIIDAYHQKIKTSLLNQKSIEPTYWGSIESTNIIEYFIDSIKKNNEMFPNEKDAKKVHELVLAANKSRQKNDWILI